MRPRIAITLVLLAGACSNSAADNRDDTPPDIHFERKAASSELAALGVHSYAFVDDGRRVLLFGADDRVLASVQADFDRGELFAEAVVAETSYAIEGEPASRSWMLDGEPVDPTAPHPRFGFQLLYAAAPLVLGAPNEDS